MMDYSMILETARRYSKQNEFGKSCSYYLYLFNGEPSFCHSLQDEFVFVVYNWIKKLILLNRIEDVFSFVETAVAVCQPIKMELILISFQALFASENLLDSAKLITPYREEHISNFKVEESIEHLYNVMVDRWHFRMLNDCNRNMAYAVALKRAYEKGHRCILDIGSGSGIFSLIAKEIGFNKIYSCEASVVMCDIQKKCIQACDSLELVQIINEYSTNINFDGMKPTLIVTEIFDCGLFGESVLPVLVDAHERLVDAKKIEIIPHSAVIYGICIECEEIGRHSRYNYSDSLTLYGSKDPGDSMKQQPYTTEYMATIKGGYRKLSNSFILKSINFNCPSELKELIGSSDLITVPIISSGRFDAVMVYFTLKVDSESEINTIDKDGLCWEQAIFTTTNQFQLEVNCKVQFEVLYTEEFLDIKFVDKKEGKLDDISSNHRKRTKDEPRSLNIDRRLVARLNDEDYVQKYQSSLSTFFDCIELKDMEEFNVCILCPEVTIIPLLLKKYKFIDIYLIEPSPDLIELLKNDFSNDRIHTLFRGKLVESSITFDLVISEPIDCGGFIMEGFIEDLISVKSCCCASKTKFIPSKINVNGCCFSSDRLLCENRVLKENIPYDLNIDEFMNEYKVKNHPDINGCQITEMLSDKKFFCCINLLEESANEALSFQKTTLNLTMKKSGCLTGLMYWYDIVLNDKDIITTEPSAESHFHQACYFFDRQKYATDGEVISLRLCRNKSNLHFNYL